MVEPDTKVSVCPVPVDPAATVKRVAEDSSAVYSSAPASVPSLTKRNALVDVES